MTGGGQTSQVTPDQALSLVTTKCYNPSVVLFSPTHRFQPQRPWGWFFYPPSQSLTVIVDYSMTKRLKRQALKLLSLKKANGRPLYSKYEVADILKVSRQSLYNWMAEVGMENSHKSNFKLPS